MTQRRAFRQRIRDLDWPTALKSPRAAVLVLLVTGAYYFRRTERTVVDMIWRLTPTISSDSQ
jgi:hypothetical protein